MDPAHKQWLLAQPDPQQRMADVVDFLTQG
jgi:hypothetical protein